MQKLTALVVGWLAGAWAKEQAIRYGLHRWLATLLGTVTGSLVTSAIMNA